MAIQRKILKNLGNVALIEERIYIVEPALTIHVLYSVTSSRESASTSFDTFDHAKKYFDAEVARSRPSWT